MTTSWRKRPEGDLLAEWDQKDWKAKEGRLAEIFSGFLKKAEQTAPAL